MEPEGARGVVLPATGIPHFEETKAIPLKAPSSPVTVEQELPASRPQRDRFNRDDSPSRYLHESQPIQDLFRECREEQRKNRAALY
jgi:hypothetical protein